MLLQREEAALHKGQKQCVVPDAAYKKVGPCVRMFYSFSQKQIHFNDVHPNIRYGAGKNQKHSKLVE